MSFFVSLRLRKLPVVHWFDSPVPLEVLENQEILVRTQHGSEVAKVLRILPEGRVAEIAPEPFVREFVRTLDRKDMENLKDIARRENEAFAKTKDLIVQHKLNMKLLKAEYLFDVSRLILYYKAENKVDFRELLKSLASTFKTRIELRQIGVRDETKLLGGLGCCGKMVCCAQFMSGFHPVSTKMAKDQNLSMNPTKLSGICHRLLCCLSHEHRYYASFHGKFPKIGAEILMTSEKGRVLDLNYITQKAVLGFADRRKSVVPLDKIRGKKDPATGRNLWWVQEGDTEPDLSILQQPAQPAPSGKPTPEHSHGKGVLHEEHEAIPDNDKNGEADELGEPLSSGNSKNE